MVKNFGTWDLGVTFFWDLGSGENIWDLRLINYYFLYVTRILFIYNSLAIG